MYRLVEQLNKSHDFPRLPGQTRNRAKSTSNLTISKTGKPPQLRPYNDHVVQLIFGPTQIGQLFALTESLKPLQTHLHSSNHRTVALKHGIMNAHPGKGEWLLLLNGKHPNNGMNSRQ